MKHLAVDKARKIIFNSIKPINKTEKIKTRDSLNRILSEQVFAKRNQPSTNISSMDGFAVNKKDLPFLPKKLKIVEEIKAGNKPIKKILKGDAARVFTGSALPKGANKVILQENCHQKNGKVLINSYEEEDYIRKKGEDFKKDIFSLKPPRIISSSDIALISSMNHKNICVFKRPKIAILANGNELIEVGENLNDFLLPAATKPAIISLVRKWGGIPIDLGIAKDETAAITTLLKKGLNADMIVTIGGASIGKYDLIYSSLKKLKFKLKFWKIAMRPGKPLMFGSKGIKPILGLPGNPVSSIICSEIFLKMSIYALQGYKHEDITMNMILGENLPENTDRKHYMRARIAYTKEGDSIVIPLANQDSASLKNLSESDVLIIREPNDKKARTGSEIKVIPIK